MLTLEEGPQNRAENWDVLPSPGSATSFGPVSSLSAVDGKGEGTQKAIRHEHQETGIVGVGSILEADCHTKGCCPVT